MDRELSGIYFRIQRGDRWVNIDLTDMTDNEIESVCKGHSEEWLINVIQSLCGTIQDIGNELDLTISNEWEGNE